MGGIKHEPTPLTARERDVLVRLMRGQNGKQIAPELGIRYNSIDGIVQRIRYKLGAYTVVEAAVIALLSGEVTEDEVA